MATRARVSIREARKDELPLIRRLSMEELRDELNEAELKHLDQAQKAFARRLEALFSRKGNEVYVAAVDGSKEMAGYLWFGVSDRPFSGMEVGWIFDVQVVPSYRGKGVGEALMRHALEVSKMRGFEETGLMVRAGNRVAYSLYEKLGFNPEYVLMTRKEKADSASNS